MTNGTTATRRKMVSKLGILNTSNVLRLSFDPLFEPMFGPDQTGSYSTSPSPTSNQKSLVDGNLWFPVHLVILQAPEEIKSQATLLNGPADGLHLEDESGAIAGETVILRAEVE